MRVTLVDAIGTIRRMHSSASATNASAGHEVAHRVRRDRGRVEPLGEPQHRADLGVGAGLDPMFHGDDATLAAERLTVGRGQRGRGVRAPGGRETPGVGARPEQHRQPGGMRADLLGRDPRVAARAEQVRVGEQPAEVRVAGRILGEQHHVRIAGRRRAARGR